ncbi:zinc ABC transporter substrate-binding protein AztC [Actinomyces sp. B33]|uniref:zinc ABC transporter substrate-binding protein AztC n=1 Tax=Actinomyces sp. B33 TaxID=2942131 RepID=UPI002340B192|nr:zinc ABC transporter substrate-binding protein AztC [Actinomyces sp. B33]MDC4233559.1 zinc ABC transporter substrate-binding protein AztC [Actinomyces sp. B33]
MTAPRTPLPRRLAAGLAALAAGLLAACSPSGSAPGADAADQPTIVATTNILGDIVARVAGDQARVVTLMPANADPHSFGVSAQDALVMQEADLLVANGLGLEEGLAANIDAAEQAGTPLFEAGDHIDVLQYATEDASGPDPHFWTDPAQVETLVAALADEIVSIVPGVDEAALRASADAYRQEVAELGDYMTRRFNEIPADRRALVTNHHVFGYLANAFGFEIIGAVIPGGATLAAPSASDLKDLADAIDEAGVPAIFAESSSPDKLVQALAEQVGIDVQVIPLYTESLTDADGEAPTYLDMMRVDTDLIADALSR